jgi:Domain of unknown function (DUF4386)
VNSTRRVSVTAGALFIVATAASLTAAAVSPGLTGANYLAGVADHSHRMAAAAFLYLIAAGGSVGIAIALYPVLKVFDDVLALGAVVFRAIEAVFYTVGVVSLLSLVTVGQGFRTARSTDRASYQLVGDTLLAAREHAAVAGVFAFGVGALMSYLVFYRSRLVPRWLSGWGLAGVCSLLLACLLALINNNAVTGYVVLAAPIGVQEIVLAGWLLVKGFSPSALPASTSSHGSTTTPTTSGTENLASR